MGWAAIFVSRKMAHDLTTCTKLVDVCTHARAHTQHVNLVSRDQVLYLILRTPFRASYFYVSLTWELGKGVVDTPGSILHCFFAFISFSSLFRLHIAKKDTSSV